MNMEDMPYQIIDQCNERKTMPVTICSILLHKILCQTQFGNDNKITKLIDGTKSSKMTKTNKGKLMILSKCTVYSILTIS